MSVGRTEDYFKFLVDRTREEKITVFIYITCHKKLLETVVKIKIKLSRPKDIRETSISVRTLNRFFAKVLATPRTNRRTRECNFFFLMLIKQ